MKKYTTPMLEMLEMNVEDVLTESPAATLRVGEFENEQQWWKDIFNS